MDSNRRRMRQNKENSTITMRASKTKFNSSALDAGQQQQQQQQPQRITSNKQQRQLPSVLLFVSVILLVNLCPFHQELEQANSISGQSNTPTPTGNEWNESTRHMKSTYLDHIESCLNFIKLMFSNPMRLGKRTVRYTQAEAKVLGKMAKIWYIKKKIKKFGKKLKKHTIAVPVFTAIPIYEHSYYPQPQVTHVSHGAMQQHAAASSYAPTVAQRTSSAAITSASASQPQQQMATSASNNHPAAYRVAPPMAHYVATYHHRRSAHRHGYPAAHRIINHYAPSPPTYVDGAAGLYGHYGNAYGRYDGGYHVW